MLSIHAGPRFFPTRLHPTPALPNNGGALEGRRFHHAPHPTNGRVSSASEGVMRFAQYLTFALLVAISAPAAAQNVAQATSAAARAGVAAAVRGDVTLAATPGVRAVGKN